MAPGDGAGLERLARYLLRSPVSLERLELDGSVVHYRHKRAAKRRKRVEEAMTLESSETARKEARPCSAERRRLRRGWAQLIRRFYEVDPLLCPCGETMRISFLTDPRVVRKILRHLESPGVERPRGPPRVRPEPSALAS